MTQTNQSKQQRRFIVLEGLDGAGKSTQISLLKEVLTKRGIPHQLLHFPQTDRIEDSPIFGAMVADFLKGEYGAVDQVNPYLVALLYAGDRYNAREKINQWLEQGYFVILDRYVYSNIAFQGAKCPSLEKKNQLKQWILNLEYEYYKIPAPSLSIFLHMDFQFIREKLQNTRAGGDRSYLAGKADIHESSLDLQQRVEQEYLRLVGEDAHFFSIPCHDGNGLTLAPATIHDKILDLLVEKGLLTSRC